MNNVEFTRFSELNLTKMNQQLEEIIKLLDILDAVDSSKHLNANERFNKLEMNLESLMKNQVSFTKF